jgi:hypothetical protein
MAKKVNITSLTTKTYGTVVINQPIDHTNLLYDNTVIVTKIRFERDGYNKNKQGSGPVYIVECGDNVRAIITTDDVSAYIVEISEIEEEEDVRQLPEGTNKKEVIANF